MPSRVVVLGARGFIGRAVLPALAAAGIPALPLGSDELDLAAEGAGPRLAQRLKPDDAVLFLAAITPDKGRGIGPFMTNLRMGAAVCEAIERVKPPQVIYVSSDAVYPMRAGLINEQTCAEPVDLYGAMHLAREIMVRGTAAGRSAILRPTLVYGADDTHNSYGPNRLRRMARKDGRISLFGAGEEMRDHIAIDDVAALVLLVLRHRSMGTINLATGRSISYADLAGQIAALFPGRVEIVGTPRQAPVTHRHFDVSAIRRAFPGFVFTTLEDGLAKAHREMLGSG
jgi:UDP-glucose 4-epimerase